MPPPEATRLLRPTSTHAILQAARTFSPRFSSQRRCASQSFCPILLRLALHRRRLLVLHVEPGRAAPEAAGRVLPLRNDAFQAELAGVAEGGLAVALDVLVPAQARPHLDQQGS